MTSHMAYDSHSMLWSIGQFPELDHLDPAERAEILRRVPWWTYPWLVARGVGVGVIAGIVTAYGVWLHGVGGLAQWAAGVLVALLTAACGYLFGLRKIRKSMRRELIGHFRGQRPPFCLFCGYDLRASTSDRCVECGRVVLYVPSASNRLSRFTGKLVGSWLNKR